MNQDTAKTLKDNVTALLLEAEGPWKPHERVGKARGTSRLMRLTGLPQGTAQRLLQADAKVAQDAISQVADAFKLYAWQLLTPNLDPKTAQTIAADARSWPFPLVNSKAYWSLNPTERAFVQGQLELLIANRGKGEVPVSEVRPAPSLQTPTDAFQQHLDLLAEHLKQFPTVHARHRAVKDAVTTLQKHLSGELPERPGTAPPRAEPSAAPDPRPRKQPARRPSRS